MQIKFLQALKLMFSTGVIGVIATLCLNDAVIGMEELIKDEIDTRNKIARFAKCNTIGASSCQRRDGFCSIHDYGALKGYQERLIAIEGNLTPLRSEQKKKEELLDLEIQIKKLKLQKLINKDKEN